MKITPIDVAHKKFDKTMFGFDPKAVVSFLQDVSLQMEGLIKERNTLRDEIRNKEIALIEYKERDELLKNTLTSATQMSERMREEAEKQTSILISEAKIRANQIGKDAHENLKNIHTDLARLKKLRLQYEANMKAMAHAHLSLLEEGQKYLGFPDIDTNFDEDSGHSPNSVTGISPLSVDII
jgi:cell division initiation protein